MCNDGMSHLKSNGIAEFCEINNTDLDMIKIVSSMAMNEPLTMTPLQNYRSRNFFKLQFVLISILKYYY